MAIVLTCLQLAIGSSLRDSDDQKDPFNYKLEWNKDAPEMGNSKAGPLNIAGYQNATSTMLIADGLIRSSLLKRPNLSRGRRLVHLRSLDDWIESGLMQVGGAPYTPNPEIQTGKEAS